MIESAYRLAEACGIPVWCQDEAGPYQAIPHPGAGWFPHGDPDRQPHEYVRGGTAKLLTLFRPATGAVRATGVTEAPNIVLHPWLQAELSAILGALPERAPPIASAPFIPDWWERRQQGAGGDDDPPLRLILIWDNLAGHKSAAFVRWLCAQGILPLYTPLSGSWLNMAESLQRIIVRRAGGAAPTDASGDHRVVGGDGGGMECRADAVRVGGQTLGTAEPGATAIVGRLRRDRSIPAICGLTH